MTFEEGDLVFWNYNNKQSIFGIISAGKPVHLGTTYGKLFGAVELEYHQPIFFYRTEITMVCKNVVDKDYEIKDVEQSKVILRNDETLITLQDLFIEGKLVGHKVLLGDTQKWILA